MATYPSGIPALNNPLAGDLMSQAGVEHDVQHSNANDEIEAIAGELGINPKGSAASVAARLSAIDTSVTNAAPSGVVSAFAGAAAPSGWLLCAGQAVSRTTYAALFTAIGTSYGAGDGTTTFNLPDLRGRSVFGIDNMDGTDAGRLTAANALNTSGGSETMTSAMMPAHTHTIDHGHGHSIAVVGTGTVYTGYITSDHVHGAGHDHAATTSSWNGDHAHSMNIADLGAAGGGSLRKGYSAGGDATSGAGGHNHTTYTAYNGMNTGGVSANHQHDYNHGHSISGSVTNMTGSSGSTGSGTAGGNMPPFMVMNYIIKT